MAKQQIQEVSLEEGISKSTQRVQGSPGSFTYPQQLLLSLLLHKRFLQFLV